MRNSPFFLVIIGLMIVLDIYVFQALKVIMQPSGSRIRIAVYAVYWGVSVLALVFLLLLPYLSSGHFPKELRNVVFALIVGLFFGKLITSVFLLVDDFRRGAQWITGKFFFSDTEGRADRESDTITRSVFLSWLGMAAGSGLFGSLIYGFTNKYNYQIKKQKIHFPNLPPSFKGLKVVHLSDIHSGSFNNKAAVQYGIERVLDLKPDLILFTGDLVNNKAEEMHDYMDIFSQLKAPLGVYSVLGNHDYGDYVQWESPRHKEDNLNRLKQVHSQIGWRLLLNENVVLEREGEQIALIGIENWSAKANFPKYGRLDQASKGIDHIPFKILMSHDPSHWDAEVIPKYKEIDLMLAGHTHGMQFGVEVPWLRWSPVQYVYKQWAGLYESGHQKLYVNRGFGFLGYPGRVGILPEITLLEFA